MKDRSPRPLSESQLRLLVMSPVARLYSQLGGVLKNPLLEDSVKVVTQNQRWQIFNRMTEGDRESVHSYEKWQYDEQARKRASITQYDMNDHI